MRAGRNVRARVEQSSGNVFADLGLPNPEREILKAQLVLAVYRNIKSRGLTQAQAGRILGIAQPHVCALMNGRSAGFSVERLLEFLAALGHDVEVCVKPKRKRHGKISVAIG